MAERRSSSRSLLVAGVLLVVLVLAVLLRGSTALLAAASVAAVVGLLLAVTPLLRSDGIDWDWQPKGVDETPPEPGVARVRRLLDPSAADPEAPARLQSLVRVIAKDRVSARAGGLGEDAPAADPTTALARYLAGPPRLLDLAEVERVITDLETLTPRRTT